ncbi:hypothetical protein QVD17_21025 [Tagetes erecta]|uniref:Uncharacterized protein n=1 Tax=Tagetes erecta TaxID=13708 RepID=A0AAD8NRJ0_TARER|nr:hypothetical protein QVD17_21025 [Tagetes erecta]
MFGVQRDSTIAPRVDSFMNISDPPVFDPAGFIGEIKGHGGKKRKKIDESSQVVKPREVVHVRAKRGEATDSHSLAERTMGMSVMLDVIINYVQSLQNQIEFLSMKLTAASMFYDFNSTDMDEMGAKGTNGHEAQMMERMVGEGYGGDFAHF